MKGGLRHGVFAAVASLVLVAVLVSLGGTAAGVPFPAWTGIGNGESELEGREYTSFPAVSRKSVASGEFQAVLESFLSDHVPMRDSLLMADAAIERVAIRMATVTAGYSTYPTFFGSNFFVSCDLGIVVEGSMATPGESDVRNRWINALNTLAERHPDMRFAVNFVMEPRYVEANPVYELSGGKGLMNDEWARTDLVGRLDPELNARIDTIADDEELAGMWFKSDTHWTLKRALQSYNWIAGELDLNPVQWRDDKAVVVLDGWPGSAARSGRYFCIPNTLVDQNDDFSHLEVYKYGKVEQGKTVASGVREAFYASGAPGATAVSGANASGAPSASDDADDASDEGDADDADDEEAPATPAASKSAPATVNPNKAYSSFYGATNLEIVNKGNNNGRTCLVVADSFIRNLWRYIASNYERTILLMPGNKKVKEPLAEIVDKRHIDDTIVLMQCHKCEQFDETSPGFLNGM